MRKIGVTGGIGSGKSIVCEVFNQLGVPVYNSDFEAKKMLDNNIPIKDKIYKEFGNSFFIKNEIDKKKLANLVFNDKKAITVLNNIIHPAVAEDFNNWLETKSKFKYIIKEAAILFESGIYKDLDKIVLVNAPKELRIKRVMKRDNVSESSVKQRMKNQWSENKKIEKSDYIIYNDENHLILPQIIKLHNTFNK